ncbi:RlpA-like double-psi beta-barrel-containing domain containing protein [Naviculisporaceae sp. PSN 640]
MFFSKTAVATALLSLLQLTAAAPAPATEGSKIVARESGDLTYYNPSVGYGACGWLNGDHEHVVALNKVQFDPYTPNGNPNRNTLCGRKLRVRSNGREVVVAIVDRCPSCNYGDLDLSPSAFQALGYNPAQSGRFRGDWDWL